MPNPELGCTGLKSIFVDHIYLKQGTATAWELTAAISGAHTLGSATIANSGYNGFWSVPDQASKFNNDYYKSMMFKGWYQEKAVNGNNLKNQFKRIDLGLTNLHKEMMLSTDMCLAMEANEANNNCNGRDCDAILDDGVPLLAQSHDCCAWVQPSFIARNDIYPRD